jgi:hypothetical protein
MSKRPTSWKNSRGAFGEKLNIIIDSQASAWRVAAKLLHDKKIRENNG